MKKNLILIIAVILATIGLSAIARDIKRVYKVAKFDEVVSTLGIKVEYTVSDITSCTATGPEDAMSLLKIEVKNGKLILTSVKDKNPDNLLSKITVRINGISPKGIEVTTGSRFIMSNTMTLNQDLDLEATTGGSISINGVKANEIDVESTTAGSISLTNISARKVDAEATTGASVNISGSCSEIDLEATTGASINAKKLEAVKGKAESTTGASITCSIKSPTIIKSETGGSVTNR